MGGFLRTAWSRVRSALRMGRVDEDFQRELESHLDLMTEENLRRGMSEEDARRAAAVKLGGITQLREANRDIQGLPWLETLGQDLRYGWRVLCKRQGLSVVAALTLALGIGANTAIFSVVDAVFLRPLPFPNAQRIYIVRRVGNMYGGASLSMPLFIAWQKENHFFEHIALFSWRAPSTLTGSGEPERFVSSGASVELFDVLNTHPVLGRDFAPEEGRPGGARVVILSDRMWRNRFQSDPKILGRVVTLDGEPWTVVGVMPPDFALPFSGIDRTDIWFPIRVPLMSNNPSNGGLLCLGLLKSDATPAQGEASLTPPLSELRQRFPSMFAKEERVHIVPLRDSVSNAAGAAPMLLFGAVMLVLLIACVNVANLFLVAANGRHQEMALRVALGARRARVMRQLLTESVLLAVCGGAVGVAACYTLFGAMVRLVPASTPHVGEFRIDSTVLLFSFLLSIATGLMFGLAPALSASRVSLNHSLKSASPRPISSGFARLRGVFAANEVALSFVLLVGAALALQSLSHLMNVQPGFDSSNVLAFRIDLPAKKYDTPPKRQAFFDSALARFAALPGVKRASAASSLPFLGGGDMLFTIEDGRSQHANEKLAADIRIVSPDFFPVLHIPVESGRNFGDHDRQGNLPVALINRSAAKAFWSNSDPIGSSVWIGKPMGEANAEPAPRQIIGVVADVHESSLADPPEPTIYIPLSQNRSFDGGIFALRTQGPPMSSVADVRTVLHSLDPDLPLTRVRTMEDIVGSSVQDWRFRAVLLGGFGALALFIATIGVYGVISYSVAQRTREIGIRMALGARRNNMLWLVLRQGMTTVLMGVGVGLLAAFVLTRVMANFLFGVNARDPITFTTVAGLLVAVSLSACCLPARRAMKVDPMMSLRHE